MSLNHEDDLPISTKVGIILLVGTTVVGILAAFSFIFSLVVCTQMPGCSL